MSVTKDTLYNKYLDEFETIFGQVTKDKAAAIPFIIAEISTKMIPDLMTDVGKIKSMSGDDKKQLIIDTVEFAISKGFEELNKIPELAESSWDEMVRDILLKMAPRVIDLLISVEKDKIVFNKKVSCGCW